MTQPLLYGMHDREGRHLLPAGGWCVDTVALNENPPPTDYIELRADIHWLVRLNYGYGSTGTLPLPHQYGEFAAMCAQYVAGSPGINRVIIGNEPNHENERPHGVYITPAQYAECFLRCRDAIKRFSPQVQVIPAPCAPYHANPVSWLDYLREMLTTIAANGGCDGIAVHAYTRSSEPADIGDDARMGPPLDNTCSGFLTYQDALEVVPAPLRHLPAYITEFDELLPGGWEDRNTGVVQEAYRHINWWNTVAAEDDDLLIQCLVLYRWPRYDPWYIEGKQGVIYDFRAAVALGFESPAVSTATAMQEQTFMPSITTGGDNTPALPPREWDERLDRPAGRPRATLIPVQLPSGATYWRLVKAKWRDEQESRGQINVFVDVLDENGKRLTNVPVEFAWPGKSEVKRTEAKPGERYAVDFPMFNRAPAYNVHVLDGTPSDSVDGLGLGSIEQPDYNIHTSYDLVFQRAKVPAPQPTPAPITATAPHAGSPLGPPGVALAYVIAPAGANLRQTPDVRAGNIITAIPYGAAVTVAALHKAGNGTLWSQAHYQGASGWIAADLLGTEAPTPLPAPSPAPQPTPAGDNWPRIYAFIRKWEGGFANNPNDPGGATNKGITLGTYTRWRQAHGQPQPTVADLHAITDAEVEQIFYKWYYVASGADKLPWPLCLAQADTAVNAGVGRAEQMLQQSGGNFLAYMGHLIDWYTRIDNFEHFGRAWIQRRADLLLEASK